MARGKVERGLPGWWERERQRQLRRIFLFLILVLLLIGFYYWQGAQGVSVGTFPDNSAGHIVFVRQDKEGNTALYSVDASGSDLRRLTDPNDHSDKREPAWTIDGKAILYVSNKLEAQNWQVYFLGPHYQSEQLTYGTGNKSDPISLPGGQRFAFIAQGAIKTETLTKKDVYQELPPPSPENNGESAGSQDMSVRVQGAFESAAFRADGPGVAGVKDVGATEEQVDTGDLILGDQAGFAVPPNGSSAILLGTGRDVSLAWEPNGSRIACAFSELQFKSGPAADKMTSGIVLWSFDDPLHPTQKPLMLARGYTFAPKNIAWSPDGTRIAFEGWRIRGEDKRELRGIVVMPFQPDRPLQIATAAQADAIPYFIPTQPGARPERPRWSPDSKRLLFEITRADNGHDLCVVDAAGGTPVNLTRGEGNNTQAAWSPVLPK